MGSCQAGSPLPTAPPARGREAAPLHRASHLQVGLVWFFKCQQLISDSSLLSQQCASFRKKTPISIKTLELEDSEGPIPRSR